MNTSAIIMLAITLGIFLGGIAICITRVGKRAAENESAEMMEQD